MSNGGLYKRGRLVGMTWDEFEFESRVEMAGRGIRVRIGRGKRVRHVDGYCRGWFDGEEFVVAGGCAGYRGVYLHEYCHFRQWCDRPGWWEEDDLFSVLGSRPLGVGDWGLVEASLECERDCEARVLRLLRGKGWVDGAAYARAANANLFYYHYVYLRGSWGGSGSIMDKRIMDVMPSRLVGWRELGRIDMGMMRVYEDVFG